MEELLADLTINMERSILETVQQGAGWESWYHIEIGKALSRAGHTVRREQSYPDKPKDELDLLVTYNGVTYAIEVKVESARKPNYIWGNDQLTAGFSFMGANDKLERALGAGRGFIHIAADGQKVTRFSGAERRLFVFVSHSDKVRTVMQDIANDGAAPPVTFRQGSRITVTVADADAYRFPTE